MSGTQLSPPRVRRAFHTLLGRVQISARHADRGVPECSLHFMQFATGFEQLRAEFVRRLAEIQLGDRLSRERRMMTSQGQPTECM